MHPNVHAPWAQWSNDEVLHVAVAYSNPYRWTTRRRLMNDFIQHMRATKNVRLYVGELAYGDRPHEVTGNHPDDLQLRTHHELFHKENILNLVIARFQNDWKYGCYCDGDFTFTRHDWALETIHMLQHHHWVQPFSTYTNLSPNKYGGHIPGRVDPSFAAKYVQNGHKLPAGVNRSGIGLDKGYDAWPGVGATGGCWAFTRYGFDTVGGLMDQAILGHADWFMAFGLVGAATGGDISTTKFHPNYQHMISTWQAKASLLKKNIGVVDQFVIHHFHGPKKKRAYDTRDQILVKHNFDPVMDLKRNYQGVLELTGNKPDLRDEIRRYFISRDEDNPSES